MATANLDGVSSSSKQISEVRPTKIEDIPGIGKKSAQKILEYFKDDRTALEAIRQGSIGEIPGFSYKQALKFAKQLFELEEGITSEDILKTEDIREIYENLLLILSKYTKTEFSKAKLQTIFPLPSSKNQIILRRQAYFQRAVEFVKQYRDLLETKNLSPILYHLSHIVPPEEFRFLKNRIILTDSSKILDLLSDEGINKWIQTELVNLEKIEDITKFFDQYCNTFDVVIMITNNASILPDLPNLVIFSPENAQVSQLFPEKIIQTFASNRKIIDSAIKTIVLLKSIKDCNLIKEFVDEFDLKHLKTLRDNLTQITDEGEIAKGLDKQLDEYQDLSTRFHGLIIDTENLINQAIQTQIGERSIRLEGKQILEFFRTDLTMENIRNYIPPEVDNLISEAIDEGKTKLQSMLKFGRQEEDLFMKLKPEIIEYPIVLNEEGVRVLERKVRSRISTYLFQVKSKIAKCFQEQYSFLTHILHVLLEFEFFYAIGQFAMDFNLSMPKISIPEGGFYGTQMVNIELMLNAKSGEKPIPISYQVGNVGPESVNKRVLTLLTGSNSGGKTMCLLTCIEALLLSQMGLPSLGSFEFTPFDELYFFKKSSGQISAGAFEITLKQFVKLAQSDKLKIVFADELEAITEPNAAAKVIAGIFSLFLENPRNYGVFVTHLVEFLLRELDPLNKSRIRIDGIEAAGLDDKLQLIIDRNPKFDFIAKSTPELILKQLANSGSDTQRKFFELILQKFH